MLLGFGVRYAKIPVRILAVTRQIPVAPVVDPFDLLPPEREEEFDIDSDSRVVGQLVLGVAPRAQLILVEAQLPVEAQALLQPVVEPLLAIRRVAEELELRLFEFAGAEGEVARIDLVAKRLADLGAPA
jgi:hypothetical protein